MPSVTGPPTSREDFKGIWCPRIWSCKNSTEKQWLLHGEEKHQYVLRKKKKVDQSCPTLFDRMDCSPPGSSVHGVLQARILEWVAIPFSRSSRARDRTWVSYIAGRFFTIWATRKALYIAIRFILCINLTFCNLLNLFISSTIRSILVDSLGFSAWYQVIWE